MDHRNNNEEVAANRGQAEENAPGADGAEPHENDNGARLRNNREIAADENGVIEAGMAVSYNQESDPNKLSSDCDVVLLFQCHEDLQTLPESVAKNGSNISIGLDKATKLHVVFSHFVQFCTKSSNNKEPLTVAEIEFVHNDILKGTDTVEASALMKNDVIKARRKRPKEKKFAMEKKELQMGSDSKYFKHFKDLMKNTRSSDVGFVCGKRLESILGRGEITAHAALLSRRCPWLKKKISDAKEKRNFLPIMRIPADIIRTSHNSLEIKERTSSDVELVAAGEEIGNRGLKRRQVSYIGESARCNIDDKSLDETSPKNQKKMKLSREDGPHNVHLSDAVVNDTSDEIIDGDDSDDDSVQPCQLDEKDMKPSLDNGGAAKVVAEEGDLPQEIIKPVIESSRSKDVPSGRQRYWVDLNDHPVQAVKILIEYCYTNRCLALGEDAFSKLSKGYIVKPYQKWPKKGMPTISMNIALATITLAEKASLPRLSYMCEIAATHLLDDMNIIEALCVCSVQSKQSGNPLPRLRKAAMLYFLQHTHYKQLAPGSGFRKEFDAKSQVLIPSVLVGTEEVLRSKDAKDAGKRDPYRMFKIQDPIDRELRNKERRRRA